MKHILIALSSCFLISIVTCCTQNSPETSSTDTIAKGDDTEISGGDSSEITGGDTTEANPCDTNPCINGTCFSDENSYTCVCDTGYRGVTCEDCTTDYILDNDHCINHKQVPCNTSQTPLNATASNTDVDISYTSITGWSSPENCTWTCNNTYHTEDDVTCISNTKILPCVDDAPTNAVSNIADVMVTWDGQQWPPPSACSWDCVDKYYRDTNVCVSWTDCMPGQRIDIAGSVNNDQSCIPCEAGTFTSAINQSTCAPCTCVNGQCDQTIGTCSVCNDGWLGNNCDEEIFHFDGWSLLTTSMPQESCAHFSHYDPVTNKAWLLGGDLGYGSFLTTASDFDLDTQAWSSFNLGSNYTYFSAQNVNNAAALTDSIAVFLYNDYLTIFDASSETIEYPWRDPGIYIPSRDTYSAMATDGRYIFIVGGYWDDMGDDLWIYDTANETLFEGPSMNYKRAYHAAEVSPNGYLYAFGGLYSSSSATNTIEKINISNMDTIDAQSWTVVNTTMTSNRYLFASVIANDGTVYLIGGYPTTNEVEAFDTNTDGISPAPSLNVARYRANAVMTSNSICVFGGRGSGSNLDNIECTSNEK